MERSITTQIILLILLLSSCGTDPSPPLIPEIAKEKFHLAPGLSIHLVASEPLVQEPVAMSFDAEGRLWVVEMRGFMPDIDRQMKKQPQGAFQYFWIWIRME